MKSTTILSSALVAVSYILGANAAGSLVADKVARADPVPTQPPITDPKPGVSTSQGCYNSAGNMTAQDMALTDVSSGSCRALCKKNNFYVFGLRVQQCFCGFVYPPEDALVDDKMCKTPCPAYGLESCGSLGSPGHWSVYNMGVQLDVGRYEDDDKPSSTSTKEPKPTSTAGSSESTIVQPSSVSTSSSEPAKDEDEEKPKSGPNVGGIVGGVVAGLAVAGLIAGGLFFFMRRRRNTEIEEEHRRNAAVNAFISGSKSPGSSGSISMTDSRLDPVMAHRRMSDGSIADNEDYSRKILRVTNA